MYYPYFRGKQFELVSIREKAKLIADSSFVPIIEPVRESLNGLQKALDAIREADGEAVVIINPSYGDHQSGGLEITTLLESEYSNYNKIRAGILTFSDMTVEDLEKLYARNTDLRPILIHSGFNSPKLLASNFENSDESINIFMDDKTNILYRKNFDKGVRVLIKDGFNKVKNADYPAVEEYSDLHITYSDFGMDGFGDFLTVGDSYSEGGGPAYAVAIHLTFINPDNDDVMYIYHFVSDTKDTPTDPAGKFLQALNKLIALLDSGESHLEETSAIKVFRELHAKKHFPGLGYVKNLSMNHHLETMAKFLG